MVENGKRICAKLNFMAFDYWKDLGESKIQVIQSRIPHCRASANAKLPGGWLRETRRVINVGTGVLEAPVGIAYLCCIERHIWVPSNVINGAHGEWLTTGKLILLRKLPSADNLLQR